MSSGLGVWHSCCSPFRAIIAQAVPFTATAKIENSKLSTSPSLSRWKQIRWAHPPPELREGPKPHATLLDENLTPYQLS